MLNGLWLINDPWLIKLFKLGLYLEIPKLNQLPFLLNQVQVKHSIQNDFPFRGKSNSNNKMAQCERISRQFGAKGGRYFLLNMYKNLYL
jgi:hypothetical protein